MDNNQATVSDDMAPEIRERVERYTDLQSLPKQHFINVVEDGRLGHNAGVPNGMPALNRYTYGTHMGRYYLTGAESSAGKTTLTDFAYVLQVYKQCKLQGRKLYLFYYSFEISKMMKKARWVSYFLKVGFDLDIPSDYILGYIPGMLVTDEHMKKIQIAYAYVEEIFENIIFVEDPIHPTRIFHDLVEHHYEKNGEVQRHPSTDKKKRGLIKGWIPNDPRAMTVVVMDHVALLMNEQGFDTKQTIDLMSKYFVILRNLFGLTVILIQQFNTELTSTVRTMKKGEAMMAPQRIDFGDSRYTFRDADVVLGLLKPFLYDVKDFHKYDITKLMGYMIGLYLMKNRYGAMTRMLPLFLNPIAGVPEDLPLTPSSDLAMGSYYEQANKLEQVCQQYSPKDQ